MRSNYPRLSNLFFLLFLWVIMVADDYSQTAYGGLRGAVTDIQGATIQNAQITLTNEETKIAHTGATNATGNYIFSAIDPGTYTVSVVMPGFKRYETKGNVVSLGNVTTVDATLQIGEATDSVEITADSLMLDTASASGGQVFTSQQVEDMPLLGRNPFMMESFDANVVMLGDPRYVRAEDQTGSSQVSLAGAPSNSNSYVVDGIPISTSSGGVTFIPTVEAVEDAKIQMNTYDAEMGRTGGGIFASNLKTGSARLHGVLYGETRQTGWSSNLWFDTISPAHFSPTPNDETYIYEGAIGGPLFPNWSSKPHWLNNTFFWIDEAGYRQGQPLAGVTTTFYVPTAAERTGDFSADTAYPLYDPTQRLSTGADTCLLSKFGDCGAGGVSDTLNVIPDSYKNAIGVYIANAFPNPTSPSVIYGSGANFTNNGTSFKSRDDTYSGKLEHIFTSWYTATISYVHSAIQEPSGNALVVPYANSTKLLRYTDATAVNNTITVNPTTLVTVAYGFNRYYSASFQYSTGFNAANGFGGTGFAPGFANILQSQTFPAITLTGVSGTASVGASNGGPTVYASHNWVVTVSKILGRHNLKAGYEYRGFNVYSNPTSGGAGAFTFNGEYSNANGMTNSNSPGAIADLIMGLPSSASVTVNSGVFINDIGYHALYAQDDLRFNDKLTINFGLRYEYELGQYEQKNRYNVAFDPNVAYTYPGGATGSSTVTAKGGLAFAGVNGYPTHCCNNSHDKFSPRIGVSFTPMKKTVVHAGFGFYFAPIGISAATTGYSQTSSYSPGNATGTVVVGSSAYLSDPFPNGVLQPTGNNLGALTGLGSALTGTTTYAFTTGLQDFRKRNPFVEQYSFDIERQLPYDVILKVGYYGAHARNWTNYANINQIPDSVLATYAPGGANAGVNLSTKVMNPYYSGVSIGGLPATGVIASSTVARGQLLLPFPQFQQVFEIESSGYSNYNSLVVKGEKRMARGLTVLATYTWSANWDNIWSTGSQVYSTYGPQDAYNPKGEYARSLNSIPNRFTLSASYNLPFGRGQKFAGHVNRVVDAFIGGWQVNDEWIVQNGVPVSVIQTDLSAGTYGTNGIGGTYQRPNVIGDLHSACVPGHPQGRLGNFVSYLSPEQAYINPAAFTPALPYTYGNVPRSLPCRVPGLNSSNISVFKEFSLSHGVHFQFRAEALNAFNTPEFGNPSTMLGLTTVGSATCPTGNAFTTPACIAGYTDTTKTGQSAQSLGNITTTIGFARIIQLGGKLSF